MPPWLRHALPLALLAALAFGVWSAWQGWWRVPDRHNPWAPLVLAEPPGWLTRHKLGRLVRDPQACLQTLQRQTDWRLAPLPDRDTGPGCGFRHAVRIERTGLQVGAPFSLTCPAAVSLALWERHAVLPAALDIFGQPVVRLQHFGSYACRNVAGRATRSRHATAQALDVAGFVLADGRRITLAGDWYGDAREQAFLRRVHAQGCRFFDGVLGPDYNRAHADHLHLERGGFRMCR